MWPFSLLTLSRRGRAARRLLAAREQVAAQAERDARKVARAVARFDARHPYVAPAEHYDDGALLEVRRGGRVERRLRVGPNEVHACVAHADGSFDDLGVSTNLLTNIGRDVWSSWMGAFIPTAQNAPATATSATSLTGTGTTWTASNLATPQLGCASFRVYAPVTGLTTAPVYANTISNTTSVLTLDQWWKADDTTGTTPASTNSFIIAPGGIASVRFIGLTTNASAASAANTTLASEITTNGGGRALGTYAHTMGASTYTLTKAFSISGSLTSIHRAGAFVCLSSAGADPLVYETVLNADATVVSGDTLTITWTWTLSG
jgi:hypothetical protein